MSELCALPLPVRARRCTLESLGAMPADAWERALYAAYRAQQERSMLLRRMAEGGGAELLQQRADSYEEGAGLCSGG